MRGLLIRVAIIGAIAGGAWAFRDFLTANANDLAVGDCFDPPQTTGEIDDVQRHPCTDLHGGEVIFVGGYEPASATYPTAADFEDYASDRCIGAFFVYTGLDYNTAGDLTFGWYVPTEESWKSGNRRVICYALDVNNKQLNASVKKAS